ncbi:hypothetical protein [uncultured Draconibacterium sp.]|uniref:hypothetical protein n=1 Tax=uncultured Draconibacterium sp. TaxID=1573823 RepID=UPI002AA9433B|nr:hypothetical protein [uncultured Draconibacterium sp.]
MKKSTFILFLLSVACLTGFAQLPDAFNYQAAVRSSSGEILADQNVNFKISILEDTETGNSVYSETHAVSTNSFGLVNIQVGQGTVIDGVFDPGNWGASPHFLKIEIDADGGDSFTHMGTSQLLAVPYAFHAKTVEVDNVEDADADATNEIQTLSLSGTQLTLSAGGGTVTLPSSGETTGDNWGTQTVISDASLTGNGTSASPLSVDGDLTDDQTLSLSGNNLTISDGNTVSLPTVTTPWQDADNGITYQDGHVGIGDNPTSTSSLRVANYNNKASLFGINNSEGNATIQLLNQNANGQSAYFRSPIRIADGSQGEGKILMSDAGGIATWGDLPTSSSLWSEDNSNIYYTGGKVAVGKNPGSDLRQFQSVTTENHQAVAAENNGTYPTLYVKNNGSGPAAEFKNRLRISDGTQGDGKVLTSDASGNTSWETQMTPIAYGIVNSNGVEFNRSSNVAVTHSNTGEYVISIENEDYFYQEYICNATIINGYGFIRATSSGGKLFIKIKDSTGTDADMYFSFVVFKL